MSAFIDMTGRRFGTLTVKSYDGRRKSSTLWLCLCDCGRTISAIGHNLRSGSTSSCGCKEGHHLKHGHNTTSGTSTEYNSWQHMIQRCENSNHHAYKYYGGRGITACERWRNSFELFLLDMGYKPSSAYTIDRINNNGNYEPENCRWMTRREQNRNRGTRVPKLYGDRI